MEADAEWSDASDAVVKSGSHTGASDFENEAEAGMPGTASPGRRGVQKVTTFCLPNGGRVTPGATDPVTAILDRIDAEIEAVGMPKRGSKPRASSMSRLEKQFLESQGVEFDTADENLDEAELRRREAAAAAQHHSDLDSVAAQQIDEKFKEIMKKKRGGYLDNLKSQTRPEPSLPLPKPQKDAKNAEAKSSEGETSDNPAASSPRLPRPRQPTRPHFSMQETGRVCMTPPPRPPKVVSLPPHPKSTRPPSMGRRDRDRSSLVKNYSGYGSDGADSIRTEDFEAHFQELMVKNVGGVPITRFSGPHIPEVPDVSCEDLVQTKVHEVLFRSHPVFRSGGEESRATDSSETTHAKTLEADRPSTPWLGPDPSPDRRSPGRRSGGEWEESGEEATQDIERESSRILQEMERDRRPKSVSPSRHSGVGRSVSLSPVRSTSPHSPTPALNISFSPGRAKTGAEPTISIRGGNVRLAEGQEGDNITMEELRSLREALHRTKQELRSTEKMLKETRANSEDARTQLMLNEFKKENAKKDLERLAEEINTKRKQLKSFDAQLNSKMDEIREFESIGISKEQARTLVDENTSLKVRMRAVDALELERDELVRQLEHSKEEFLAEQRRARIQHEEMQEEIESLRARLDDTQGSSEHLRSQVHSVEAAFRRLEKEKDDHLKEKAQEVERLQEQLTAELEEHRRRASDEVRSLSQQTSELRIRITELQEENSLKDTLNIKLRDQIHDFERELTKERETREELINGHKHTMQELRKDTDTAVAALRETLYLEKQQALEELRSEVEQDRRDVSKRAEDRISKVLAENAALIEEKNHEILRLQDLVKKLEEERQMMEKKVHAEVEEKIQACLAREREVIATEKEWLLRREKESYAVEAKRQLAALGLELEKERGVKEDLLRQIKELREELEEQRQLNRQANKDKVMAVARAKDIMRDHSNLEVERIKEKVKEDGKREMEKLKETVRRQEEEIRSLRSEKLQANRSERESVMALDKAERMVINEINEECRRSANLLGLAPRRVNTTSYRADESQPGKFKTPFSNAIGNLRACNEELRHHIHELRAELDSQRNAVNKLQKEKDDSVESLKTQMEKDRTKELENLKEKLIREHNEETSRLYKRFNQDSNLQRALQEKDAELVEIQRSLNRWKEETSEKFARQFELELAKELEKQQLRQNATDSDWKLANELQQQEIDRLERELQRLAATQGKTLPYSPLSGTRSRKLQQLQSKLRSLQSQEPGSLRRSHFHSSTPDLTKPATYGQLSRPPRAPSPTRDQQSAMRVLEERTRQGESESVMAEHRVKNSQNALSQRMAEISNLQNTMTNQTKDLIELERAYSQLHRQYNTRSPSPTPRVMVR